MADHLKSTVFEKIVCVCRGVCRCGMALSGTSMALVALF